MPSPPQYKIQLSDAEKVIGEVITLDFLLTPNANADKYSAAVPLDIATTYNQYIQQTRFQKPPQQDFMSENLIVMI